MIAAATSLAGIFCASTYTRETAAWAAQAIGQDYANLPVAVALVWSAAVQRKRSPRALLVWLGCLLYFIYAFAIYAFAVHFNRFFLAYVAVLGLSFYALVGMLTGLDLEAATAWLRDHRHRNGASTLLIFIGVMFSGLWLSEILPHTFTNTPPPGLADTALWTNPVHVLDLAFLLPAMVLVGVLLRKQHPWGLLLAVPLLVFAVTMGIGILALFGVSAMKGFPVSAPATVATSIVVVLSCVYVSLMLRHPHRPA